MAVTDLAAAIRRRSFDGGYWPQQKSASHQARVPAKPKDHRVLS
jgi:hypothetical protein